MEVKLTDTFTDHDIPLGALIADNLDSERIKIFQSKLQFDKYGKNIIPAAKSLEYPEYFVASPFLDSTNKGKRLFTHYHITDFQSVIPHEILNDQWNYITSLKLLNQNDVLIDKSRYRIVPISGVSPTRLVVFLSQDLCFSERLFKIKYRAYDSGEVTFNRIEYIDPKPIFDIDFTYSSDFLTDTTSPGDFDIKDVLKNLKGKAYYQKNQKYNFKIKTIYAGEYENWRLFINDSYINYKDNNYIIKSDSNIRLRDISARRISLTELKFPLGQLTGDDITIKIDSDELHSSYIIDKDLYHGIIKIDKSIAKFSTIKVDYSVSGYQYIKRLDLNPTHYNSYLPHSSKTTADYSYNIYLGVGENNIIWNIQDTDLYIKDGAYTDLPYNFIEAGKILLDKIDIDEVNIVDIEKIFDIKKCNKLKEIEHFADKGFYDGKIFQADKLLAIVLPTYIRDNFQEEYEKQGYSSNKAKQLAHQYIRERIDEFKSTGTQYFLFDRSMNLWDGELE